MENCARSHRSPPSTTHDCAVEHDEPFWRTLATMLGAKDASASRPRARQGAARQAVRVCMRNWWQLERVCVAARATVRARVQTEALQTMKMYWVTNNGKLFLKSNMVEKKNMMSRPLLPTEFGFPSTKEVMC